MKHWALATGLRARSRRAVLVGGLLIAAEMLARAQMGTAFTYQGRLTDNGVAPTGVYDLRFTLHTAATGTPTQVGPALTLEDWPVTAGVFTVTLDFGTGVVTGPRRWLQVEVRPGASTGGFTLLTPRQELTPTPHALVAGQALAVPAGTITSAMIAPGAVGSAQLAAGAVGLAQIDQAQVQARITGACPIGQYFRGIAANGSVVCEPVPGVPTITTVDDPANLLMSTSLTIGSDGLPVICYHDATAGALKVLKCGNSACSAGNVIAVADDPANHVGVSCSITLGADGLPVIAYHDTTAGALKVAHCGNTACSARNTITTVDGPGHLVGLFSSIAVASDRLPVVAYYDLTAGSLKVAKCADPACSVRGSITVVDDPPNDVGRFVSMAIGSDGLPVISYLDYTAGTLKVAKCGNAGCSAGNTITVVDDPTNAVGWYTSLAIGLDGWPVIAYHDTTAGTLKVAKCGNASCTENNRLTTLTTGPGRAGVQAAMAVGPDGLPVIAFQHQTGGTALAVVRCGTAACSNANTLATVIESQNEEGVTPSVGFGPDGLPVISSIVGHPAYALKVLKCGTRSCL